MFVFIEELIYTVIEIAPKCYFKMHLDVTYLFFETRVECKFT